MTVIQEFAEYLEDQGIGVVGTNIFYSRIPDKSTGTWELAILDRLGPQPDGYITDIESPMVQIFIRSSSYDIGRAILDQVREALHGLVNVYLIPGGTYYRKIMANQEGGSIGKNENGRDEFSINFNMEVIKP